MKEFLAFKFKVEKAEEDENTGYLEGMISTFGNVDQGYDRVIAGAFKKTIKDKKGVFPMLLDHDQCRPAGYMKNTQENDKGVAFKAELKLFDPAVRQRYELAKMALGLDTPMGTSIGYSPVKFDYVKEGDGAGPMIRNLREIKLYEGSLVTFPMNEMAGVTRAKSMEILAQFDRLQKSGYDLNRIQEALSKLGTQLPNPKAAEKEIDPVLIQSMDSLIQKIRG